jgi:hypothetical protein
MSRLLKQEPSEELILPVRTDDGEGRLRISPRARGFLVGAIVGSPFLAFLRYGIDTSDSLRLIAGIKYVQGGDWQWLLRTQDAVLPHLIYGPWVALRSSTHPMVVVPVLTSVALAGVISYLVVRLTGKLAWGAAAAALFVAAAVAQDQARELPLYPIFTIAGTLGLWVLIRMVRGDDGRTSKAFLGGLLITLGIMAHGAGLYFLPLAFATVVFVKDRAGLRRYAIAMGLMILCLAPWGISHLWIGGLHRFMTPRDAWVVSKGYVRYINLFRGHPIETPFTSARRLPGLLATAMRWPLWVALPFSAVGFAGLSKRSKAFAVLAVLGLASPIIVFKTGLFPRYFYPPLAGFLVLAGMGLSRAEDLVRGLRWSRVAGLFQVAAAGVLALILSVGVVNGVRTARHRYFLPVRTEIDQIAALIDDGKSVIGARSFNLLYASSRIHVYFADLLSEPEYVAYLTWDVPRLKKLLAKGNIGWALLKTPVMKWEVRYNRSWLEPFYGKSPVHPFELRSEAMSCLRYEGKGYLLYQLQPCE